MYIRPAVSVQHTLTAMNGDGAGRSGVGVKWSVWSVGVQLRCDACVDRCRAVSSRLERLLGIYCFFVCCYLGYLPTYLPTLRVALYLSLWVAFALFFRWYEHFGVEMLTSQENGVDPRRWRYRRTEEIVCSP
ncbi:hypothetical protein QBC47DRAFT_47861 [Echria macrotheca]|uniref:Uncharacterized protein n=1 Tax=Echria macrotheca TaxID=438768 RepID=A0AAJ0FA36_9PEZI|nr:hypothetical protein QBC47DRAFT_47861 [Echria macrotheca]